MNLTKARLKKKILSVNIFIISFQGALINESVFFFFLTVRLLCLFLAKLLLTKNDISVL